LGLRCLADISENQAIYLQLTHPEYETLQHALARYWPYVSRRNVGRLSKKDGSKTLPDDTFILKTAYRPLRPKKASASSISAPEYAIAAE
jgi:hypothetical protein